jgi:hypothetical protein
MAWDRPLCLRVLFPLFFLNAHFSLAIPFCIIEPFYGQLQNIYMSRLLRRSTHILTWKSLAPCRSPIYRSLVLNGYVSITNTRASRRHGDTSSSPHQRNGIPRYGPAAVGCCLTTNWWNHEEEIYHLGISNGYLLPIYEFMTRRV